jgi:hypothetical protein
MADLDNMTETDQHTLDAILAASAHLTALAGHVRAFATIMCSRRGQELEEWMAAADVGGHVNRLKMVKRQMFGRANPDLLRT